MPAFIKTPEDEARWDKAKKAANKTRSESEGDTYWGLVNHIYQSMKKSIEFAEQTADPTYIDNAIKVLEKAREKLYDPNEEAYGDDNDVAPEEQLTEHDEPGEDLTENDPAYAHGEDEDDEDDYRSGTEKPAAPTAPESVDGDEAEEVEPDAEEETKAQGRFKQPSPDEISELRQFTVPHEARAREHARLDADPNKQPELAHQGNLIEARNKHFADRKGAYQALANSPEYKKANAGAKMEMDEKFNKEWKAKNPENNLAAMKAHAAAHAKGQEMQERHKNLKGAQIEHVLGGGAGSGGGMSTEEAMQHVGGTRGEQGTTGTMKQDPAAAFAAGNQDFVKQYAQDYANKGKKVRDISELENYDEGAKRDIGRILGPAAAKNPKFEQFFSHYHPLIHMSAKRTLNKLGLDKNSPDIDMSMLHEAGMHGLVQAINDYKHDNPGKASFATHAGNKIRGLQMTALKNQDQIPSEVRQAQKKFVASRVPGAPKGNDLRPKVIASGHSDAKNQVGRLAHIDTARATQAAKRTAPVRSGAVAQPKPISAPVQTSAPESSEEE